MAEGSDQGPKEIGPSYKKDMKGENDEADAPRRTRLHVLATVGAAMIAISAIAVTTWALANRGDDAKAGPDTEDATSTASVPEGLKFWDPDGVPTVPPTTPSTLPSFPTPSILDDPTLPTPSVPFSTTTAPAYSPPAYTPPATTPPTTAPTTSPTSTPPAAISVRPQAPEATTITKCGTWGSVSVARTTGVKYTGDIGNRLEGRWEVKASARDGYRITAGATTRWHGNLRNHRPCPGDPTIDLVTKVSTGVPEPGAWDLTVATTVPGTRDKDLVLTFSFGTEARVAGSAGDGWTCPDVEEPVPAETPISCVYTGDAPPDVTLGVVALDGDQPVEPTGSLTLTANGDVTDAATF